MECHSVCVLTCLGTPGGQSLGRLADSELYVTEGADGLPQTTCYCCLAEDQQRDRLLLGHTTHSTN